MIKAFEEDKDLDLTNYLEYFDYNKVIVMAVGVSRPAPPYHWIYVPDERIVFHRYAWISNYSPNNAPVGQSLALLEITISKDKNVDENLPIHALNNFLELANLDKDDIIFTRVYVNDYGYPIHTLKIEGLRDNMLKWFKKRKIISPGRWGSWMYWNMDAVYKNIQDLVHGLMGRY